MLTNEMETLAAEARKILEGLPKRDKHDLSTRAGWAALLEATTSKRYADQLSRQSLERLRSLSVKWQRLYYQLRFEAVTRPVWNT